MGFVISKMFFVMNLTFQIETSRFQRMGLYY
jgi:hypothetical protein